MDIVRGRSLDGQVHVVTGGDDGLGYQTALALAAANATVVLGCRDAEGKGADAARRIETATGNSRVAALQVDLSSFDSTRLFAAQLLLLHPKVHVLVCNAGIPSYRGDQPLTEDGFERVMQVNFLSHFVLVEHLLPSLRSTHGRVVLVSSDSAIAPCVWGQMPLDCMDIDKLYAAATNTNFSGLNMFYTQSSNYGLSKYLMVFQAAELARREPNVSAYAVSLGITKTDLLDKLEPPVDETIACFGDPLCPASPEEGAATSVYLAAASPSELGEGNSGALFGRCAPMVSVRSIMAAAVGEAKTLEYQSALYDMLL